MGFKNGKSAGKTPDRMLLSVILSTDRLELARKLSLLRDRDIAVSMTYLSPFEKDMLVSLLPPGKAERVREEMARNPVIKYSDYRAITEAVTRSLSQGKNTGDVPESYFRPGRGRSGR